MTGLTQDAMLEKYLSTGGGDGIRRDERTFKSLIMPNLEQLRRADRKINVAKR